MANPTESLFQPCIIIEDDGTITIDWSDSYVNTMVTDESSGLIDDVVYEEPMGNPHSTLLDSIVLGKSTADGLRALADHIEAQG